MTKLGIIGAENSHSVRIGTVCNVNRDVPMRVTHLWGETEEAAQSSAESGAIPNIVGDWKEMEGKVDGVMIDHRDGGLHFDVARHFIERGVPTFVDKPMTTDLARAIELFDLAEKKGVPICTFGTVPLQKQFRAFAKRIAHLGKIHVLNTSGPVDLESPYGGIFFYGIHQVDAIVELMGTQAIAAQLTRCGENGIGTIFFSDGRMATMNCLSQDGRFHWRACLEKGVACALHKFDPDPYLVSARTIHKLVARGVVPWSRARMLAPIAILQAFGKSLESGEIETVPAFDGQDQRLADLYVESHSIHRVRQPNSRPSC